MTLPIDPDDCAEFRAMNDKVREMALYAQRAAGRINNPSVQLAMQQIAQALEDVRQDEIVPRLHVLRDTPWPLKGWDMPGWTPTKRTPSWRRWRM